MSDKTVALLAKSLSSAVAGIAAYGFTVDFSGIKCLGVGLGLLTALVVFKILSKGDPKDDTGSTDAHN